MSDLNARYEAPRQFQFLGVSMLFYTDRTLLGNDENGDAIVYDWALEPGFFPQVRVEAHRKFVSRTTGTLSGSIRKL